MQFAEAKRAAMRGDRIRHMAWEGGVFARGYPDGLLVRVEADGTTSEFVPTENEIESPNWCVFDGAIWS